MGTIQSHENVTNLQQQREGSPKKVPVGKGRKFVWCSEAYEPNPGYMSDLVGREKEIHLITAAWIPGHCTPPLCPLLVGAPGVGKNRLVYELSRMSGRELFIMQGHEDVTAEDMACAVRFSDDPNNNMDYVVSPLTTAMLQGGICFIDEIGKIRPRALSLLASVLDDRRYIDSILLGERIHASPGFRLIAATNSGEVNMLPEFIRSRLWPVISVGFPEKTEFKSIIGNQFPESQSRIEALLDTFWALWAKTADAEKKPSPRDAIHIFTLASNLSDLEMETEGEHGKKYDRRKGCGPTNTLTLKPKHLESAFEHLFYDRSI